MHILLAIGGVVVGRGEKIMMDEAGEELIEVVFASKAALAAMKAIGLPIKATGIDREHIIRLYI